LRAALDMVTAAAVRLTRARGAIVMLMTPNGRELEVASASEYDSRFEIVGRRFPLVGSLSERVIRTGRAVRSRDLALDRRPLLRALQRTIDVRGIIIV